MDARGDLGGGDAPLAQGRNPGEVVEKGRAVDPAAVPGGEPQMFQNPGVTLEAAVLALAVLVTSGVLAGLAPARRAVAITPMEALRS